MTNREQDDKVHYGGAAAAPSYEHERSPRVCALVLNWNGADEAIRCLESLCEQTYPDLELLIVDNGSTDDSVSRLSAAFPHVSLLQNAENLGFAGGVNVGLRHAMTRGFDYVLPLNNDLVLAPDCVQELVNVAGGDVAFVTGTIYYSGDSRRIWSIGGHVHPLTLEKTHDVRGDIDRGQLPPVMARDLVPGGATLMACAALEEIGLFDERFFLYYEDNDLSLRARRAGFRAAVATKARMWHAVASSSGGSDSPRERYWMARSSARYFAKNAQAWQVPIILFWRSGSAVRTTWRLLRRGKRRSLSAYWRGLRHGVGDLFKGEDRQRQDDSDTDQPSTDADIVLEIRLHGVNSDSASREAYDTVYSDVELWQSESFYHWMLEQIDVQPGQVYLDVSCGRGELVTLAQEQERRAFGLDLSLNALRLGRTQLGARGLTAANGQHLPFSDGTFDVISNIGSLEHYVNMEAAVGEMARVLKPGGRAVVLLPNTFSLMQNIWIAFRQGRTAIDPYQPIQRYGARLEWQKLLEENGLAVVETRKYERIWPRTRRDLLALLRRPKEVVRVLLAPLIPLNLAFCFIFVCHKGPGKPQE